MVQIRSLMPMKSNTKNIHHILDGDDDDLSTHDPFKMNKIQQNDNNDNPLQDEE